MRNLWHSFKSIWWVVLLAALLVAFVFTFAGCSWFEIVPEATRKNAELAAELAERNQARRQSDPAARVDDMREAGQLVAATDNVAAVVGDGKPVDLPAADTTIKQGKDAASSPIRAVASEALKTAGYSLWELLAGGGGLAGVLLLLFKSGRRLVDLTGSGKILERLGPMIEGLREGDDGAELEETLDEKHKRKLDRLKG